ncbi:hypothetical protein BUN20_22580 [Bacteroides fragilis]|uniref:hypothetical protein n=1 Tax=Bacteroides fragilis TaxID=817 RepID=UPI000C75AAD8|nr:hypothetical protein [Bacteroides fragilis]AUI49048.1 hypothetical protein BUN20_22580 [Bacteroides fragilis]
MRRVAPAQIAEVEARVYAIQPESSVAFVPGAVAALFYAECDFTTMVKELYALWQEQSDKRLNQQDYTTLAYELAIRLPAESEQILRTQRARIDDPDASAPVRFYFTGGRIRYRTARYFVQQPACSGKPAIEPWTAAVIRYLNHPLREEQSVKYIRPDSRCWRKYNAPEIFSFRKTGPRLVGQSSQSPGL